MEPTNVVAVAKQGAKRVRSDENNDDDDSGQESMQRNHSMDSTAASPDDWREEEHNGSAAALSQAKEMGGGGKKKKMETVPQKSLEDWPLRALRLEAMFHPKFENEHDGTIRERMMENLSANQGYLEVTLKHSGSLLLWSGGRDCFYSKNSVDNVFTAVGEVLLRQHFARAWGTTIDHDQQCYDVDVGESHYKECCAYVQTHRLTLAFEVVTSILGDHGATPQGDFCILTAVADRSTHTFFSTLQLVALAHRFRLAHNDVWTFRSTAAQSLFHWYDTPRVREQGLASTLLQDLGRLSDGPHLESMYPHTVFQGDVLEGVVLRYVSFSSAAGAANHQNDAKQMQQQLQELATESTRILQEVPPQRPPPFRRKRGNPISENSVLMVDLRQLYQQTCTNLSPKTKNTLHWGHKVLLPALHEQLAAILERDDDNENNDQWPQRRRHVENPFTGLAPPAACRRRQLQQLLPSLVAKLRKAAHDGDNNVDPETDRIARLVERLQTLEVKLDYKMVCEQRPNDNHRRWLCIVHIYQDESFARYRKAMQPGDMDLFRGFVVQLFFDGDLPPPPPAAQDAPLHHQNDALMLKMKLLPYMVRTFCCRNALGVLSELGPEAYMQRTLSLLTKWNMSQAAISHWQPFLRGWAHYVLTQWGQADAGDTTSRWPPLSESHYLDHLEHFTQLYKTGKVVVAAEETRATSTLRGVVVLVGPDRDETEAMADKMAAALCCRQRRRKVETLNETHVLASRLDGGLVCSAVVQDGVKTIRKLQQTCKKSLFVVLWGCTPAALRLRRFATPEAAAQMQGMSRAWRSLRCALVVDLEGPQADAPMDDDDEMDSAKKKTTKEEELRSLGWDQVLEKIRAASDAIPVPDNRRGALVFFPSTPGSGKSALCRAITTERLHQELPDEKDHRQVQVLVSDELPGKFWPQVQSARSEEPSSILVADKNVPPGSWPDVGGVCAKTHAMAIPVLPDDRALRTTTVHLSTFPFSLPYLAVCMARVLARGPHPGKLNAAHPQASLVVVHFFTFYQGLTAETLLDRLGEQLTGKGALRSPEPIRLPFFHGNATPEMPPHLEETLGEAICFQLSRKNKISSKASKEALKMEESLRRAIASHSELIHSWTVDEEASQASFLSQVARLSPWLQDDAAAAEPFIKIVAINVEVAQVHAIVRQHVASKDPSAAAFFREAGFFNEEDDEATTKNDKNGKRILETHVTMAHCSATCQRDMRATFGNWVGQAVDLEITALFFSHDVSALAVRLPPHLPPCQNSFPHITLWHGPHTTAVKSNELPALHQDGKASVVTLTPPVSISGVFAFWNNH